MAKIEIGRFSELMTRIFGMKGVQRAAGDLSPEISPIFQLEAATDPQWDYLKQVRGCAAAGIEAAGGVGNFSVFRVVNPALSGAIAVVYFVALSPSALAQCRVTRHTGLGNLANVGVTVVPDFRWGQTGGTTTTSLIFSSKNNDVAAPAGDLLAIGPSIANTQFDYLQQTVLVPGTGMDFGIVLGNTQCTAFLAWKERQLPVLEQ